MARVTSELVEIASMKLRIAKAEIMASGDSEAILWTLDQFRQLDAWLRLVIAENDSPSDTAGAEAEAEAAE
jgi:hypothetical protein